MSAKIEVEPLNWEALENLSPTQMQIQCLLRNSDKADLVAPLREMHAGERAQVSAGSGDANYSAALAQQERWTSGLREREQLQTDLKRGREFLEQIRRELAGLKNGAEDWTAFERVCGKNPLADYMESVATRERIEKFLPAWLERREQQLLALNRDLEQCAKENGLEHLVEP